MHANKKSNLIAIFAIAAALSSGTLAFAATDTNPSSQKLTPQEKTVNKDFSKVSADGSGAFMDMTLTRLAISRAASIRPRNISTRRRRRSPRPRRMKRDFLQAEANLNAMQNNQTPNSGATANQQNPSNNNQQNANDKNRQKCRQ